MALARRLTAAELRFHLEPEMEAQAQDRVVAAAGTAAAIAQVLAGGDALRKFGRQVRPRDAVASGGPVGELRRRLGRAGVFAPGAPPRRRGAA